MNGVCLLIVVMKYICNGTRMNGTIISISSSNPGVNIIPHWRSSYTKLNEQKLTSTPKELKDDRVKVNIAAITKVIMWKNIMSR